MTKQEIFNKVWLHMQKQGRQSMDIRGACKYRGPGGTMCAVGIFINDETAAKMEESVVTSASEYLPEESQGKDTLAFLRDLQICHDNSGVRVEDSPANRARFLSIFNRAMRRLAKEHGLAVPNEDNT